MTADAPKERELAIEAALAPMQKSIETVWAGVLPLLEAANARRALFVSAVPGEGTSTIAACTAVGLARYRQVPVLLVEANLHAPSKRFQSPGPDLEDVLSGACELKDALRREPDVAKLKVLPACTKASPRKDCLTRESMLWFFEQAGDFEAILVDSPPLIYPEARMLLQTVEAAFLVCQSRRTKENEVKAASHAIRQSGVQATGVLLNRYQREAPTWIAPEEL